jgi:hypothetical protein
MHVVLVDLIDEDERFVFVIADVIADVVVTFHYDGGCRSKRSFSLPRHS